MILATLVCDPVTCQHGDKRHCLVLWRAPVTGLTQQVELQHLVVEFFNPGLRQNHDDAAALDKALKLFLKPVYINLQLQLNFYTSALIIIYSI